MTDDRQEGWTNGTVDTSDAAADVAATEPIERTLRGLAPPGASVSVLAIRARDGRVLASRTPDRAVLPASNMKLVTAGLALDRLGPASRFETTVAARGPVTDRVLDGDLVLRGTGAPDLTPSDLSALCGAVADSLDRVEGDLVCDSTRFVGPQRGPGRVWTDEYHAYGARSSALALSGNVAAVTITTGGDSAVRVEPEMSTSELDLDVDVAVDNSAATEESDDGPLDMRPAGASSRVRITGRLPPDERRTLRVPVKRPVHRCGRAARDALSTAGVRVTGTVRVADRPPETGPDLHAVRSGPVEALVERMGVESDNFIAEQLARAIAATETGTGSWTGWRETAESHLATLGIETTRLCDGSGLSRYNRLPARGIVTLLSWAADQAWAPAFFGSLPEPGEGTLADRLDGVPVAAKTGTLTGARGLSGRIAGDRDDILFSVLVGDVTVEAGTVRDRQDALVRALCAAGGEG